MLSDSERAEFGEYLQRLREASGKSVREASQETKISAAYLFHIEAGKRNPPNPDFLRRLARSYGVAPIDVFRRAKVLLPEDELDMEAVQLRRAYDFAISDPQFLHPGLSGTPSPELMRVVVEVYEKVTGRHLLVKQPGELPVPEVLDLLLRMVMQVCSAVDRSEIPQLLFERAESAIRFSAPPEAVVDPSSHPGEQQRPQSRRKKKSR
jgi:transcriptional regulator with XRE-family HTH domain